MKLYQIIDNNGISHVMPYNKIVIIKDGMQIFNPTKEMLLEDGWVVFEPIVPELTEEQILTQAKESKILDITEYDTSDSVNIFYVSGMPMWLDKATRSGLMLRFQAEERLGRTETTLWYDNMMFVLSLNDAFAMLYSLEVYASQCYDNTQRHIANISRMQSVEEIKEYDYRTDYPQPLMF